MKNWFLRRKPLFYVSIGVAVFLGAGTFYLFAFVDNPYLAGTEDRMEKAIGMAFVMGAVGFVLPLLVLKEIRKGARRSSPRRGWNEIQKKQVQNRQEGVCNICGEIPPIWRFDHKDGNRNNNSMSNCQGLCPNCHDVKTDDER